MNKKTVLNSLIIMLIVGVAFSQPVMLEIQNVDTDAGTLDIFMSNHSGCEYWLGTDQMFSEDITESECIGDSTWIDANVNGFQIELNGVTIDDASGGTSEAAGYMISTSTNTVLGFTLSGTSIPVGDGVLTQVSFSGYQEGSTICFGYDDNPDLNVISDPAGVAIWSEWGDCYDPQQASIIQISSNPTEFSISQNFPNPFNPVTNISFNVNKMEEISLVVYDLSGKEVITLASGIFKPGSYLINWNAVNNNGNAIVSGMYVYHYISSDKAITRKMLYLK